jgi:hypothetical protein
MCNPPRGWADTWQRAWPAKQSEQITELYNEAASYRSSPFRQAEVGGAMTYVERQFAVEETVECRFAEPIATGDRAAVEWWASFIEAGQATTLAGVTVLRFHAEGLVVDHLDYWLQSQGRTAPYAGGARSADSSAPVRTSSTKSAKTMRKPAPTRTSSTKSVETISEPDSTRTSGWRPGERWPYDPRSEAPRLSTLGAG